MWLWKKFWNTDIIGKIYMLIILFVLIVATITVTTRYNNTNTNQVVNDPKNEINESIENTTTSDLYVNKNETITVANSKEDTEKDIVKSNVEKKDDKQTKNNETNTIDKEISIPLSDLTEQKEEVVKQPESQEKKEDIKENTKDEQNLNIEIKEEVKEEHSTPVPKEEYKVNNEMINKMKNYILNNPSDDMKQYGFEVVVDSSIVELTNQFTYTEQRMREQLIWRFGTIRIYALDYYCNGNLVMTECFIL